MKRFLIHEDCAIIDVQRISTVDYEFSPHSKKGRITFFMDSGKRFYWKFNEENSYDAALKHVKSELEKIEVADGDLNDDGYKRLMRNAWRF